MQVSINWLRNLILEERIRNKINKESKKVKPADPIHGGEFKDVLRKEIKDYFLQEKEEFESPEELQRQVKKLAVKVAKEEAEKEELEAKEEGEEEKAEEEKKEEEREVTQDELASEEITEQAEVPIFEFTARITMKKDINLEDIYTSIRAVEGVTIVSTEVEAQDVSAALEKSVIRIKFLKGRNSLKHYKVLLNKAIIGLIGVVGIEFLAIRKLAKS